jgi:hypothetical protein
MLTHLVKVPLVLRPVAPEDVPALMQLQSNSGAALQVIIIMQFLPTCGQAAVQKLP